MDDQLNEDLPSSDMDAWEEYAKRREYERLRHLGAEQQHPYDLGLQMDNVRQQPQAPQQPEPATWSQPDEQAMARLNAGLAGVRNEVFAGTLSEDEGRQYEQQIMPRLKPLQDRQKKFQQQQQAEQHQQLQQETAAQEAMKQQNAVYRAKTFNDRVATRVNKRTGDVAEFYESSPEKWTEIEYKKAGTEKDRFSESLAQLPSSLGSADPDVTDVGAGMGPAGGWNEARQFPGADRPVEQEAAQGPQPGIDQVPEPPQPEQLAAPRPLVDPDNKDAWAEFDRQHKARGGVGSGTAEDPYRQSPQQQQATADRIFAEQDRAEKNKKKPWELNDQDRAALHAKAAQAIPYEDIPGVTYAQGLRHNAQWRSQVNQLFQHMVSAEEHKRQETYHVMEHKRQEAVRAARDKMREDHKERLKPFDASRTWKQALDEAEATTEGERTSEPVKAAAKKIFAEAKKAHAAQVEQVHAERRAADADPQTVAAFAQLSRLIGTNQAGGLNLNNADPAQLRGLDQVLSNPKRIGMKPELAAKLREAVKKAMQAFGRPRQSGQAFPTPPRPLGFPGPQTLPGPSSAEGPEYEGTSSGRLDRSAFD